MNYFVRTTVGRQFIGLRMNLGYLGFRFFREGLVGRTYTIVKFLGKKKNRTRILKKFESWARAVADAHLSLGLSFTAYEYYFSQGSILLSSSLYLSHADAAQ